MAARGFLGAGDLYISRYDPDTAAFLAYEGPFEAGKFEIKPNSDVKTMASKGRTTYGQTLETVPLPQPSDFNLTLNEVNKASIGLALFGTAGSLTQGSGTVTDEVVVAKLDKWVELSKGNINEAGLVVTNSGGNVTYVLGTDYEINYRLGWIRALTSGAIAADESLKVDFGYAAISGTIIRGATQSQVRARFMLDGVNFADQLPVIVHVYEAVLTPDSAFDFLSDEFATIELTGSLKTPAGKTEPFKVEMRDAA